VYRCSWRSRIRMSYLTDST